MPCDFEVIEVYRKLCEGQTTLEEVIMQPDQQVPQVYSLYQDAESSVGYDLKAPNFQVNDIPSAYLTPSAGCTTVTEVPDQEIHSGNSPSHLTNLDLYPGTDTPFYDVTMEQKESEIPWILKGVQEESLDDDVNDVLYHLATRDILDECQMLNISKDPTQWSTEDVSKWIRHTCKKYDIPEVELEMFHMNGKCLCLLSEVDFLWRTEHGSHLYTQLEIWRNFYKIEYEQSERFNETALVNSSIESYSPPPSSQSESSLDSIPSTVGSSPVSEPFEKYLIPVKSEEKSLRPTEHKQTIHLWQFLKELLMKPESFSTCIKWIDRSRGIFKIEDSGRVAKEWGRRKNRPAMNYDKLSRSIRQYYKKGIIKKTEHSKRLVYQFCAPYL